MMREIESAKSAGGCTLSASTVAGVNFKKHNTRKEAEKTPRRSSCACLAAQLCENGSGLVYCVKSEE
jgi:hypothetical protein